MGVFDKILSLGSLLSGRGEMPEVSPTAPQAQRPAQPQPLPAQQETHSPQQVYAQQRRHPRYAVEGRHIHAYLFSAQVVELLNLSVSGVCLRTVKDLSIGSSYLLQISDGATVLSPKCTVVWRREEPLGQDGTHGYVHGMRFVNLSSDEIVRLKDFMRLRGIPDDKTVGDEYGPSALRFHIRPHERALLTCPETLNVKKISMGGMLIGSSCPLEQDSRHRMKIRLSQHAEPVRITGRVASVLPRRERGQQAFEVGVEFLLMESEDRTRLDLFIHSL